MGKAILSSRDMMRHLEIEEAFDDAQHMLDGCIPLNPSEEQVEAMGPNIAEALWALKQIESKTSPRAERRKAKAPVIVAKKCPVCGHVMAVVVGSKKGGRPRQYCSTACNQKAKRMRAEREAKAERIGPAAAATGDSALNDRT